MAARGAPPVVATKYALVHNVGSRRRSCGNSWRSTRDERLFSAFTSRCTPYCGSTSTSRWTWSGMTSSAWSHAPCSRITSTRIIFRRSSTGGTSTDRRYFGDQTTWKAHWKTTLWLERNIGPAITYSIQRHVIYSTHILYWHNACTRGAAIPMAEARGLRRSKDRVKIQPFIACGLDRIVQVGPVDV